MDPHLLVFAGTVALVLGSAAMFHVAARLGPLGQRLCDIAAAAPMLDLVVFWFLHAPHILAAVVWAQGDGPSTLGLLGYLGTAVVGQMLALTLWAWAHELMHPAARRGPRVVHTLNRRVSRWRNHAAVWWTGIVVPVFTLIRLAEIFIYPPLIWLVSFPRYRQQEWVNVSRQKFSGLVGWDLIWCLYCDWMTGVWSLGGEMLRNVESFWCPIRFSSSEKCANCSIDFPDVAGGWVPAEKGMAEVAATIEKHDPGPGGINAWFGHPVRITVNGAAADKA